MTLPRRPRTVVLRLTMLEAHHLAALVTQFADLLAAGEDDGPTDPAVRRLVPDAYPDDPEAERDFRDVTAAGLLARRAADAGIVLGALAGAVDAPEADADQPYAVELDAVELDAWLRTLTAVRLVLASRLGIETDDDHAPDDPRYGIYDWVGFRLEGLVRAATG